MSEGRRGAFDKVDEAGDELYEALEPWEQELCLLADVNPEDGDGVEYLRPS